MNISALKTWFLQNKRDFPWRDSPSPYEVWISEVMLQQTQALRVVAYFKNWMKLFPSVEVLAKADSNSVLKAWEGLGYYSRARAIHAAAADIVARFNGKIPDNAEELSSIKGLGPYTVGAILSFGFQKKHPAVDANVIRVLTRYYAIESDTSKPKTVEELRKLTLSLLPDKEPHIISEALIELGAAVCKKTPSCMVCPLKSGCKAYKEQATGRYPVKTQKTVYEALYRDVAIISCEGFMLVRRGKKGIACTGLYEFPYFDTLSGGLSGEEIQSNLLKEFGLETSFEGHLDEEKQSFTRYRVALYPKLYKAAKKIEIEDHEWQKEEHLESLTFSSGHRRILKIVVGK